MPSLNGITASIHTHDGQLEEFAVDEFPGGISCIIPAQSGQQFWLNYSIDQPLRAKAVSVEFDVDGNRIDTQFPLAAEGSEPPTVSPVRSSITSQYIKDDNDQVYRRDVFFTLAERPKGKGSKKALANTSLGTIECKVYRAEKTGEWTGRITADDLTTPTSTEGVTKEISHQARLGANMPAPKTVRYTFKNLDAEDAPYVHFKFYYRSHKYLKVRGYLPSANEQKLSGSASTPVSRTTTPAPGSNIPRPATRAVIRRSSIYNSLKKKKDAFSGKRTPVRDLFDRVKSPEPVEERPTSPEPERPTSTDTRPTSPDPERPSSPRPLKSAATWATVERPESPPAVGKSFVNLQAAINKVESEIVAARQSVEHFSLLHSAYEKLRKLKKRSDLPKKRDIKGKKPETRTATDEDEPQNDKTPEEFTDPNPTPATLERNEQKQQTTVTMLPVSESGEFSMAMDHSHAECSGTAEKEREEAKREGAKGEEDGTVAH